MAALVIASGTALQACDGDQAYEVLRAGDMFVITPNPINLALPDPQAVTGSETPTQRIITVYAESTQNMPSADKYEGRPAEGAHVEITLGETCPRAADAGPSRSEDYANYVHLGVLDDSNTCRKSPDASLLHCVLTSDGTASFKIEAVGAPFYGGTIPLRVRSGPVERKASITLGNVLPPDAVLEIADVTMPFDPIDCNDPNPSCDNGRSADVDIRVVKENGEESIPVLGFPVDIELSIHRAKANGAGKGKAWLARGTCDSPQPFNSLHVTTAVSSGVVSVVVCTDAHQGEYELSAMANGLYASTSSQSSSVKVALIHVTSQPAQFLYNPGCSGTGDGVEVRLVDCDGVPNSKYFFTSKDNAEEPITNSDGFVCLPASAKTFELPACKEPVKLEGNQ
jgi:hypothetical protein